MTKYMILYNSSVSASETMANATPEEMQASMAEWIVWKDEADKTASFDFGLPLQAAAQVTPDNVTSSDRQVSGYSVMEGDSKEEVIGLLKSHPHLKNPGASIDVLEMLLMPGM
jgi:hypothetical protein